MTPPVKVRQELPRIVRFDPKEIKNAVGDVEGFNAKIALVITRSVGTMACAYVFGLIALISLPDAIKAGRPAIISWIAQTFLQLVLLSVIMVGQNVQSLAADARSANTFKDAETILDRLDLHTQGGLKAIMDRLDEIAPVVAGPEGSSAASKPTGEQA
jgi:hypothetical protein